MRSSSARTCKLTLLSQLIGLLTDMPRALRRKGLSIFCHSTPRAGKAV